MSSQGDKRPAEDSDDEVIGPMPSLAAKPSSKKVKGLLLLLDFFDSLLGLW